MTMGRVRYTLMCNDQGGIIDDLVVCKMDEDRYFLVVNAANQEKDSAWIQKQLSPTHWYLKISIFCDLKPPLGYCFPTLRRNAMPSI
jgi:aminomethyltransferase